MFTGKKSRSSVENVSIRRSDTTTQKRVKPVPSHHRLHVSRSVAAYFPDSPPTGPRRWRLQKLSHCPRIRAPRQPVPMEPQTQDDAQEQTLSDAAVLSRGRTLTFRGRERSEVITNGPRRSQGLHYHRPVESPNYPSGGSRLKPGERLPFLTGKHLHSRLCPSPRFPLLLSPWPGTLCMFNHEHCVLNTLGLCVLPCGMAWSSVHVTRMRRGLTTEQGIQPEANASPTTVSSATLWG